MNLEYINVALDEGAICPVRAYEEDAGMDFFTPVDFTIDPRSRYSVDTGVHIEIPKGYSGIILPKSGLNANQGILAFGVVDAGYGGTVVVTLYNTTDKPISFVRGNKITQMLIMPVATPKVNIVDKVNSFDRGSNGFGSTGK